MTKTKKIIWIIGNASWGIIGFYAFLWGLFRAWGMNENFWLYPIGAITTVLVVFAVFNYFIISSMKIKQW